MDHRIAGVSLSAVEPQNTIRENKVKRLIEQFENHKNKKSLFQDLKQTGKINKFSKESQDLIADMNSTEIFELCENSSKQQCPDCNAHLGNGNNLLQLWKKYEVYAKSSGVRTVTSPRSLDTRSRKTEAVESSTVLLKGRRCTSVRSRCLRKQDKNKTGAILQFCQDGTPMQITGSHFLTSDGENTTSYCTTGSLWRSTSTRLRELKEFCLQKIGFLQQILKEEISFHPINDPTLLKQKENANDCMTST